MTWRIQTPVYTNTAEFLLQHRRSYERCQHLCDFSPNRMDSIYLVGCMLLKLYEAKKRRVSLWLIRAFLFCLIENELKIHFQGLWGADAPCAPSPMDLPLDTVKSNKFNYLNFAVRPHQSTS